MRPLPPGLAGYVAGTQLNQQRDASQLGQLQGILGLQAALEQQRFNQELQPLKLQQIRAAIEQSGAQVEERRRRSALADQQAQAQGELSNLLSTGGYTGVTGEGAAPPMAVAPNDAAAIAAVRAAGDRPMSVDVPSPSRVQALAVRADPALAIPEVLRQGRPPTDRQRYIPVSNGYIDTATNEFVKTTPDPRPLREPREPMVAIKGPDGKPVYVPSSEAAGKTPASLSGREDDHMIRRVQQFQQTLDKTGLPQAYAVLDDAVSKITPDVLPYLTGPALVIPDAALSKKVTDARQALQRLQNIELKERSGAAVTESEYTRFKKEAGIGFLKKPEQVTAYLQQGRRALDKHYQSVGAGFPEDVRNRYFEEAGRVTPFGATAPTSPSPIDALLDKYK